MSTVCPNCFVDYDEGDLLVRTDDGACHHLSPEQVEKEAGLWAAEASEGTPYAHLDPLSRAIVSPEEYDEALVNYDSGVTE